MGVCDEGSSDMVGYCGAGGRGRGGAARVRAKSSAAMRLRMARVSVNTEGARDRSEVMCAPLSTNVSHVGLNWTVEIPPPRKAQGVV